MVILSVLANIIGRALFCLLVVAMIMALIFSIALGFVWTLSSYGIYIAVVLAPLCIVTIITSVFGDMTNQLLDRILVKLRIMKQMPKRHRWSKATFFDYIGCDEEFCLVCEENGKKTWQYANSGAIQ